MKASIIASFALLVLSVYCFTWTEGLECYVCGYIDGDGAGDIPSNDFLDKSCKSGKKPNKKFKKSCDKLEGGAESDVCGKFVLEGSVKDVGDVSITVRSCIPAIASINGKCGEKTLKDLINDPELPEDTKTDLEKLADGIPNSETFKSTICSCDTDNCNSGSMIKITEGLCILTFTVLASKFAGLV